MTRLQFATTSYQHDSLPLSAQRAINCFVEFQPRSAKDPTPVLGCPGIATWATAGTGPIRGLFEMNETAYVVSGNNLYSVASNGTATLLGTGITGNGVVAMDGNDTEVIIVNGSLGFIYNTSTETFSQIGDADFEAANTVAFIDGYFALEKADSNQWFISDLRDGTSYDALMFARAESHPDRIKAVRARDGVLLIFGAETIELWDHTGAASFPFQKFKGGTVERGVAAPHAVAAEDQALFFLGDDLVFYRMQGQQLSRKSTHAIEGAWEGYETISDAFCFSYSFQGHKFVHLTFPTEGRTWVYDIATDRWHERISYDGTGAEVRWRVNATVEAYGHTLVGDGWSNRIGRLDKDLFTEFGDPVIWTATSPPIHGNSKRVFMPMFEADMETGVGLTTGQGSDPQVMLDWSDDGGHTFVGPQLWRGLGKIGAYETRLQWDRLGSFYKRVLRLRISDPVRRVLIAAHTPGLETED